jgi:hypothetical protein
MKHLIKRGMAVVTGPEQGRSSGANQNDIIALSADTRKLGEFIANLLGQRRRLSRNFDVNFFVDWPWVQNLDQLVIQRVEHQNEGKLVDFSFKLFLSNGRITHITTRTDFSTFNDFSSFECIGAELAWTFIVKFPGSATPEKQEIRFAVQSDSLNNRDRSKRGAATRLLLPLKLSDENMMLDIYYSNITWGEDLMNLISNHVAASFRPINRFIQKIPAISTLFAAPLIMIIFLTSIFVEMTSFLSQHHDKLISQLNSVKGEPPSIDLLNRKFDFLLVSERDVGLGDIWKPLLITMAGIVLIFICIIMSEYLISKSFILLNKFTVNLRSTYERRRHLLLVGIGVAFIIGTVSSIFASKIIGFISGQEY